LYIHTKLPYVHAQKTRGALHASHVIAMEEEFVTKDTMELANVIHAMKDGEEITATFVLIESSMDL
tara:strand:- start:267 stop:464 length:198 start_codon:yes stop_codon:yes gene_type:complete